MLESAPRILDYNSEYRIKRNNDVSLYVHYNAVPQPNDEWIINSKIIKKSKHTKPSIDSKTASLTIKKVETTDAGIYKLRLVNNSGEAEADINLVVLGKEKQNLNVTCMYCVYCHEEIKILTRIAIF